MPWSSSSPCCTWLTLLVSHHLPASYHLVIKGSLVVLHEEPDASGVNANVMVTGQEQ